MKPDRRKAWEYRGVRITPAGIFGPLGTTFGRVADYTDFGNGPRARWWLCRWPGNGAWIKCETKAACRASIDKVEDNRLAHGLREK